MSDTLNLALKISAVDVASGVLRRFQRQITGMGENAKQVQKDYTDMVNHMQRGLKALAVTDYGFHKLKPAIEDAANLQEALLDVEQLLAGSHTNAGKLNREMKAVRKTAIDVAANMPFSATDLARIEANLKQGGLQLQSILGPHGAAFATAALSAVSHMDPSAVSEQVAKVGHAFQLQGGQYATMADSLARVSSSSSADLQELLYNLKRAGPQAHQLNIPLHDTAVALGAVASMGDQAGTDLARFFKGMAGTTPMAAGQMKALHLSFFDSHGQFVGMESALQRLRRAMNALHNPQKELIALQKIFGQEGSVAAQLLLQTGNKSYEQINRESRSSAGLAQRQKIWAKGLNASMQKLGGTSESTLANLFDPMLGSLKQAVDLSNQLVGNIGTLAGEHKNIARAVSGVSATALLGGATYGTYHLLRGGLAGGRVLKALRGVGRTGVGIAEGEAIQAATGVAPVFVVNWPATLGGVAGASETAAASAARRGLHWKGLASLGAMGMFGLGGLTALGGLGAYDSYRQIQQKGMNRFMAGHATSTPGAWLGYRWGSQALGAIENWWHGGGGGHKQDIGGTLKIEITADGKMRFDTLDKHGPLDFEVDTGPSMVLP